MSAVDYRLRIPGLWAKVRGLDDLSAAQALIPAFDAVAGAFLSLLAEGELAVTHVEVEDDLDGRSWPKSWGTTRTLARRGADGTEYRAKVAVSYTHYNPRDGCGWGGTVKVPGLPLWASEDSVLELSQQFNVDLVTLTGCHLPDGWLERILADLEAIFACPVRVETRPKCAWRIPPPQPAWIHRVAAPGFRERFGPRGHARLLAELRESLPALARDVLAVLTPDSAVSVSPLTPQPGLEWTQLNGEASSQAGAGLALRLEHYAFDHEGVDAALDLRQRPPDWPRRGGLSVLLSTRLDADHPDRLQLLKTVSLPDAWIDPLLEALSAALDAPCTIVERTPLLWDTSPPA